MHEQLCLDCGDLDYIAPDSLGRCHRCFRILQKKLPTESEELLVRAKFCPGFAHDLTTWTTHIYLDGWVEQSIRWSQTGTHQSDRPSQMSKQLTTIEMEAITDSLRSLDIANLAVYLNWETVLDTASVSLFAPGGNVIVWVDAIYEDTNQRKDMPNDALVGFQSFRKTWDLLDSLSPYSTDGQFS